jgi:hypothetical protein
MSTVYVIGAGASFGESLKPLTNAPGKLQSHPPPLTNGFFDRSLLNAVGYEGAEQDCPHVFDHIRRTGLLDDAFGEGDWKNLDLEAVFSALEVEREFQNPESDEGARLLLVRNELVRYIRRILGLCTRFAYGENYRRLVSALDINDSIVTFNWDLLLDQEFVRERRVYGQYANFLRSVPLSFAETILTPVIHGRGLFLKLHGSLNWFRCGNPKCNQSTPIIAFVDTQGCLSWNESGQNATCPHCGSDMNPVIIPPLLRKPIMDDPMIRSAWGLAKRLLIDASRVIVIGLSAAPTDFYASWLLRSTVGTRKNVEIEVVNPSNKDDREGHREFSRRMNSIFLRGYGNQLHEFSQLASGLDGSAM